MKKGRDPFEMAKDRARKGKYWRLHEASAVVSELNRSGLSVEEFARLHDVPEKRVRWWQKKLHSQHEIEGNDHQFVEVQIVDTDVRPHPEARQPSVEEPPSCAPHTPIDVILPGDRVIRVSPGFDTVTLARVLDVMEAMSC